MDAAFAGLTSECAGAGSSTPSADVVAPPSTPATISPPPTAPLPLQRALHDDRPRAPDAARPCLISGGIVLGASAALLGAMTAGLVQNHDAARTIDAHVAKNNSVGLSPI